MNRIILIGNGFDLAHDMKTRYNHFINDYWKKRIIEFNGLTKLTSRINIDNNEILITNGNNDTFLREFTFDEIEKKDINYYDLFNNHLVNKIGIKIQFKNNFFLKLSSRSYENWVDIENEYYDSLISELISFNSKRNLEPILRLNAEFEQIKNLLEKYLTEEFEKFQQKEYKLHSEIEQNIFSKINIPDLKENTIKKIINDEKEYLSKKRSNMSNNEIDSLVLDIFFKNNFLNFDTTPDEFLILNFNYTSTEKFYVNSSSFQRHYPDKLFEEKVNIIHIHGELNNDENKIIFGYGDEVDDDYIKIEKLNNNEFLKNIKSINYFDSDNYKKMIGFLNKGDYQVFIFGHSCGVSDRTLLKSIFMHENCVSIKPFYKKDDIKSYTDIVMNISRNFSDKIEMRDKVVNKTFCKSMS